MPTKPVPKTELYQLRLKASEKVLIQEAAQAAGLGTAEYFSHVLQAVSYAILRFEDAPKTKEEFERMVGSQVASIVWSGLALQPEEKEEHEDET